MNLDPKVLESLVWAMNLFHEVRWDRCAGVPEEGVVFGWIDRDDGRSDFALLRWQDGRVGLTTSSAKYSLEYAQRLGVAEHHTDCERVEVVFPATVKNVVRLK